MAREQRRGCGYRKVGSLYLVGPQGLGRDCKMLPYALHACHVCGEGIKPSRGFTWIEPWLLFAKARDCPLMHEGQCSLIMEKIAKAPEEGLVTCPFLLVKAGLLWIGEAFYTPGTFTAEAMSQGISKRISSIPRGFETGKTWIFLAHKRAIEKVKMTMTELTQETSVEHSPGVFLAFCPRRMELVITETQAQDCNYLDSLIDRGITPIVVPDDDKDHQGSVYQKQEVKGEQTTIEEQGEGNPAPETQEGEL